MLGFNKTTTTKENSTTPFDLKAKIDNALSVFLKTASDLTEINAEAQKQISNNDSAIEKLNIEIKNKESENKELDSLISSNDTVINKIKEFTL